METKACTIDAIPKVRTGTKGFFYRIKESGRMSAIMKNTGQHVLDTSAILASSNPIMCFAETVVFGMSDEVSIKARCIASAVALLGTGSLFSRGRDMSKKFFDVGSSSSESKRIMHDLCYQMGFTVFNLVLYRVCGAGTKEMIGGTLFALGLSAVRGPIKGYSIDVFRDFAGIEESSRLPGWVKSMSPRIKKSLIVASIAASIAAMALVYDLTGPGTQTQEKKGYELILDEGRSDYTSLGGASGYQAVVR